MKMETPPDFQGGIKFENEIFIDSLIGLVNRLLKKKPPTTDEINIHKPNSEDKKRFSKILSNSNENLIYYNLIKICFLILEKYSVV